MRILIDGKLYDSTKTPILIVFDENESDIFNGMKRYVSAPDDSVVEEMQELMDTDISLYEEVENKEDNNTSFEDFHYSFADSKCQD